MRNLDIINRQEHYEEYFNEKIKGRPEFQKIQEEFEARERENRAKNGSESDGVDYVQALQQDGKILLE